GDWTSPLGRTRTLAAPGEALRRLGLAVLTCQAFGTGYYAAYRHLLDENLDLIVHLGDYIYELPFATVKGRDVLPARAPATLDDYRLRHASYRMDPDLQQAHARFPFMCMWDDHEVTDNYAGDTTPTDASPEAVSQLRAVAYRAYWEHLPLRLSPPDGPSVTLYRDVAFGDLARLCLLDERQYAAEPPCRDEGASGDLGTCAARADERQYLGAEQEQWLSDAIGQGGVTWNLIGNPTVIAGVNVGEATAPAYYLENWDGYPAARRRFLSRLADPAVSNPVVLTGDWHAGMVNDVHLDPDDHATAVVATELMTPAISSLIFDAPRAQNPQIRHFVGKHGYMTVAVESERVTAAFRVLDDVTRADSGISTDSTWQITAGQPSAQPA
ncbi:MAG: alkaline phosphatase D family protein, partial [Acidimicrobiales bacterium]